MIVLKATEEQRNLLNGYESGVSRLAFINTGIGHVTSLGNLDNPDFSAIRSQLLEMEQVEYDPPTDQE